MLIRSLAAAMAFVFMTLPGMAGPLVKVDVPPIDHLDATLVVIGADGTDHVYTPGRVMNTKAIAAARFRMSIANLIFSPKIGRCPSGVRLTKRFHMTQRRKLIAME